jgi:hypothetical protein
VLLLVILTAQESWSKDVLVLSSADFMKAKHLLWVSCLGGRGSALLTPGWLPQHYPRESLRDGLVGGAASCRRCLSHLEPEGGLARVDSFQRIFRAMGTCLSSQASQSSLGQHQGILSFETKTGLELAILQPLS